MLLESVGFEVELFASAQEFLGSNRLSQVGCLIADVRMPGMTGLQLQRQLATTGSRIPIVFITAHGDDSALRRPAHATCWQSGTSAVGRCASSRLRKNSRARCTRVLTLTTVSPSASPISRCERPSTSRKSTTAR
jgi:CheY-like chemotaxis protein